MRENQDVENRVKCSERSVVEFGTGITMPRDVASANKRAPMEEQHSVVRFTGIGNRKETTNSECSQMKTETAFTCNSNSKSGY